MMTQKCLMWKIVTSLCNNVLKFGILFDNVIDYQLEVKHKNDRYWLFSDVKLVNVTGSRTAA